MGGKEGGRGGEGWEKHEGQRNSVTCLFSKPSVHGQQEINLKFVFEVAFFLFPLYCENPKNTKFLLRCSRQIHRLDTYS